MKMYKAQWTILSLALACTLAVGCGKKDSQDDDEDTDEEDGSGPVTSGGTGSLNLVLPRVYFTVPSSVDGSSLHLLQEESKTLIEHRAERTAKMIEKINGVLERLDSDKVTANAGFSGKGPDGLMSGKLSDLTDGGDYTKAATICYDSQAFMYVKWNDDKSKVEIHRDFSVSPLDKKEPTALVTAVTYTGGAEPVVEVFSQGTPWNVPALPVDGSMAVEHSVNKLDAANNYTLTGVSDWYDDPSAGFAGDEYLVGQVSADGTGEFVGYRAAEATRCPGSFDESNTENPGFCIGRAVGSDTPFTDSERLAAWERLSPIGLSGADSLKAVTMPTDMSCE